MRRSVSVLPEPELPRITAWWRSALSGNPKKPWWSQGRSPMVITPLLVLRHRAERRSSSLATPSSFAHWGAGGEGGGCGQQRVRWHVADGARVPDTPERGRDAAPSEQTPLARG